MTYDKARRMTRNRKCEVLSFTKSHMQSNTLHLDLRDVNLSWLGLSWGIANKFAPVFHFARAPEMLKALVMQCAPPHLLIFSLGFISCCPKDVGENE